MSSLDMDCTHKPSCVCLLCLFPIASCMADWDLTDVSCYPKVLEENEQKMQDYSRFQANLREYGFGATLFTRAASKGEFFVISFYAEKCPFHGRKHSVSQCYWNQYFQRTDGSDQTSSGMDRWVCAAYFGCYCQKPTLNGSRPNRRGNGSMAALDVYCHLLQRYTFPSVTTNDGGPNPFFAQAMKDTKENEENAEEHHQL